MHNIIEMHRIKQTTSCFENMQTYRTPQGHTVGDFCVLASQPSYDSALRSARDTMVPLKSVLSLSLSLIVCGSAAAKPSQQCSSKAFLRFNAFQRSSACPQGHPAISWQIYAALKTPRTGFFAVRTCPPSKGKPLDLAPTLRQRCNLPVLCCNPPPSSAKSAAGRRGTA